MEQLNGTLMEGIAPCHPSPFVMSDSKLRKYSLDKKYHIVIVSVKFNGQKGIFSDSTPIEENSKPISTVIGVFSQSRAEF
jgi:hypothetical protein